MDLYQRLGMYFFTLGALLAILAGAFPLPPGMYEIVLVLLIFLGVFSAILNIGDDEELPFLVAGMSFLLVIVGFKFLLGHHPLIISLANFFEVVTFFIGSMLSVTALRAVFEYGSQAQLESLEHADAIDEHLDSLMFSRKEKIWNFIVFLGVATTFIVVLLEVFFELAAATGFFFVFNIIIMLIFAVDLVVLYRREHGFGRFIRNCWLDILATIPFFLILQGLAALQVLKLARLFRVARFVKLNKTLKFMSQKSGVKHYLHGDKLFKERPTPTVKTPAVKKRKKK